ncbi:hypothetical protein LCGC14_0668680 [marine sediment metagenome]|uniref:Uncharacterized protein n=1 Tax=marine sediment metagenome TaxID=412755 RepID=A0A0F9TD12_9ZZZZ
MGRVKVVEVDRVGGTIKVKFGKSNINLPILPEIEADLRRKHEVLVPGVWIDHPGMSFGADSEPTHRRKRRLHHDRVVPTHSERKLRKWRRRSLKISIDWKLNGGISGGAETEDDGKERRLTPDQIGELEDTLTRFVAIPGMEETVKQMAEALKKVRDPGSSGGVKEDKKNFVPLGPYTAIRQDVRKLAEAGGLGESKIILTRIEECSYEKLVLHLYSEGIKTFEDKKTQDVPWAVVEDFIAEIHDLEVVKYFISIKQEDSK